MSATVTNQEVDELVDRYIAAWNEGDAAERRALVAETFGASATYLDPMMQAEGREGIDAMIAGVQARFPGHEFRRFGKVDQYADRLRFQWALAPGKGEPLVIGTDIAVIGADQRLLSITGFFDLLPAQA